jgi:hypothetical protein
MTAYQIINWQLSSLDSDASIIYNLSASLNETPTSIFWLFNNFFKVQQVHNFEMGKNHVSIDSSSENSEGVCHSQHESAITRPATTYERHE